MEENKQLLDKDGNPITKERMKEMLGEIFGKAIAPLLEKCEWEQDGHVYHTWKINGGRGYTNDAGAEQINEAIKKMCTHVEENTNEEKSDTTQTRKSSNISKEDNNAGTGE